MARKKKAGGNRKSGKDAIALLEKDHEKVRGLLRQLEKSTSRAAGRRAELLEQIAQEIRVHSRIEEEIFYPAYHEAAKSGEDEKLFFEAHEEHALVDVVLPQLEEEEPSGEVFAAKAKVLKDLVEHHAEEEEEEMFPRSRKLLGKERLAELGEQLAQRKQTLQSQDLRKEAGRSAAKGAARRGRVDVESASETGESFGQVAAETQ